MPQLSSKLEQVSARYMDVALPSPLVVAFIVQTRALLGREAEYFILPCQAKARSGEPVKESAKALPRERREASLTGS